MSTSASISKINPDGSIISVIMDADGFVRTTGKTLLKHYQDAKKVNTLIDLGYIYTLGSQTNTTPCLASYGRNGIYHRLDILGIKKYRKQLSEYTLAYHRNGQEPLIKDIYTNKQSFINAQPNNYQTPKHSKMADFDGIKGHQKGLQGLDYVFYQNQWYFVDTIPETLLNELAPLSIKWTDNQSLIPLSSVIEHQDVFDF